MTEPTSAPPASEPLVPRSRHPLAPLFQAATIRARCLPVLQAVEQNLSSNFKVKRDALQSLAAKVAAHLQNTGAATSTPSGLDAPLWRHLQTGGVDRVAELDALLQAHPAEEQLRCRIDFALLASLMSSHPGTRWWATEHQAPGAMAYAQAAPDDLLALLDRAAARPASTEAAAPGAVATDQPHPADSSPVPALRGSEGLAVVSFRSWLAGTFASQRWPHPVVDAATLRHADVAAVRAWMQGTPQNPASGLEGRAALLAGLGRMLQALPQGTGARPSDLVLGLLPSAIAAGAQDGAPAVVQLPKLLALLLRSLAPLWPKPLVQGLPAGDIWSHRWAGDASQLSADASSPASLQADRGTGGYVPLHAIGQALVLALQMPLERAGYRVQGAEELTAVADQRNAALMLTAQVLVPRNGRLLERVLKLDDEAVVECRALTVALFDELSAAVGGLLQNGGATAALPTLAVHQIVEATAAVLTGDTTNPGLQVVSDSGLY